MIRLTLALGISLFSLTLTALEIEKDLPIPLATNLQKTLLPNHVTVYIQEQIASSSWASFNIVFKYPSSEHALYTFDSAEKDWDSVEDFLFACSKKAQESIPSLDSSSNVRDLPQEIAVIAVGDFPSADMLELIDTYFGRFQLNSAPQGRSIYIEQSDTIRPSHVAINITLPTQYPTLAKVSDLEQCWKAILLQELLQQRFEECMRGLDEVWIHPHPQQFYPVAGFALVPEDETENTLAFFLWHLKMVKNRGFYADAFTTKKRQILHKLHYLSSQDSSPNPSLLASYYKDQFLLGSYTHNYADFLHISIDLVQNIQFEDLLSLLDTFVDPQSCKIHLIYPHSFRLPAFTQERIQDLQKQIDYLVDLYLENEELDADSLPEEEEIFTSLRTSLPARNLIYRTNQEIHGINHELYSIEPFYQLPLSDKEREIITFIITTMAKDNLIQLAFNRRSIEKKGKKIEQVHPLRFMGHIMSNRTLRDHVRTIKKSSFKWDAFIDGFSKRMREEYSKNNIYPHIAGFAETVGSTPEQILPYIHKKDWEGLVKSLL